MMLSIILLLTTITIGIAWKPNRLTFRIVAGSWLLGVIVLVQAYTSILFTYVMAPINLPLVNSVYDIVASSDIHLLVRKGGTLDMILHSVSYK